MVMNNRKTNACVVPQSYKGDNLDSISQIPQISNAKYSKVQLACRFINRCMQGLVIAMVMYNFSLNFRASVYKRFSSDLPSALSDSLAIWKTITDVSFDPRSRFTNPNSPSGLLRQVTSSLHDMTSHQNAVMKMATSIDNHLYVKQNAVLGTHQDTDIFGLYAKHALRIGSTVSDYWCFFASIFEEGFDIVLSETKSFNYSLNYSEMKSWIDQNNGDIATLVPGINDRSGKVKGTIVQINDQFEGVDDKKRFLVDAVDYRKRSSQWISSERFRNFKKCYLIGEKDKVYKLWGKWAELQKSGWMKSIMKNGLKEEEWAIKCDHSEIGISYEKLTMPLDIGLSPTYQIIQSKMNVSFNLSRIYTAKLLENITNNMKKDKFTIVDQANVVSIPAKGVIKFVESTAYIIDMRDPFLITETLWVILVLLLVLNVSASINSFLVACHLILESPPFLLLTISKALFGTSYNLCSLSALQSTNTTNYFPSVLYRFSILVVSCRNVLIMGSLVCRSSIVTLLGIMESLFGHQIPHVKPKITSAMLNNLSIIFSILWSAFGEFPIIGGYNGNVTGNGINETFNLYLCGAALLIITEVMQLIIEHSYNKDSIKYHQSSLHKYISTCFLSIAQSFLPSQVMTISDPVSGQTKAIKITIIDARIWPVMKLVYNIRCPKALSFKNVCYISPVGVASNGKLEVKVFPDCYKFY